MKRFWMLLAAPVFALALLSASPPALATDGFASGQDLKGWCDHMDIDDINWGLCVGSITAAHDVIMTYQTFSHIETVVCTEMAHTRGDAVFAVIEYMNEHPEDLEYSLGDVVLTALADKFPCY